MEEVEGEVSVAQAARLEQCLWRWQLLISPGTEHGRAGPFFSLYNFTYWDGVEQHQGQVG